jgi:hypothetical protein
MRQYRDARACGLLCSARCKATLVLIRARQTLDQAPPLLGGAAARALEARAQRLEKVRLIAFLRATTLALQREWTAAFVRRLEERGWDPKANDRDPSTVGRRHAPTPGPMGSPRAHGSRNAGIASMRQLGVLWRGDHNVTESDTGAPEWWLSRVPARASISFAQFRGVRTNEAPSNASGVKA